MRPGPALRRAGPDVLAQPIEQHGARWIDSVIVASLCAAEISWRAGEWAGYHPSHTMRSIQQLTSNLTHAVKLSNRYRVLMCRDLEHTVS